MCVVYVLYGVQAPAPGARVVYIGGTWDLLHAGHLSVLQQAREHGDYLIVGIYSDALASVLHSKKKRPSSSHCTSTSSHSAVIMERKQEIESVKSVETNYDYSYPILSMEERMLSLLGCKHVSDVLMNAPHLLSSDFLSALGVSVVITDTPQDTTIEKVEVKLYDNIIEHKNQEETVLKSSSVLIDVLDPLRIPREKNILRHVQPTFKITGEIISHTHSYLPKSIKSVNNC
jgi:cytidyltransferase-like protein